MAVAKAKGYYSDENLDVTLRSPHVDDYKRTPASLVEDGEALLAITPTETVISYHLRPESAPKPAMKAVAALLQEDDSAIVTLGSSGIDRPAKLDGKKYASYAARFEGRIVQKMIQNDGGTGNYLEIANPMLDLWQEVLDGKADATWVFLSWEGAIAKQKGIKLNAFKLGDYGIPYGYAPVIIAHPDAISSPQKSDNIRKFLAATAKGYKFAAENPDQAAAIMYELIENDFPELKAKIDPSVLKESICSVAKLALSNETWGKMDLKRWNVFLDWLSEAGLLTEKIQSRTPEAAEHLASLDDLRQGNAGAPIPRESVQAEKLFTNEFFQD